MEVFIGRPSKKYEQALERCRNLLNSAVIVALLSRATPVCQQEAFGITFTSCALSQVLNSAVIVALLYRASGVYQQEEIGKTFTYFANGLPITSNWQTVTVCQ